MSLCRCPLLRLRGFILPVILVFSFIALAQAQDPASGIQRFSTQLGGQYDSIDPATGNIMLTIPVMSKAGKIPFSYNLVGNFHAYLPPYEGGITPFEVTSEITGTSPVAFGNVGYDTTVTDCYEGYNYVGELYTQSGFSISDATGAGHSFGSYTFQYGPGVYACGSYASTPVSLPADDGTGYTLLATPTDSNDPPTYTVYDRSGNKIGGGGVTDPDGVQITSSGHWVNGSTWAVTYTDTLGLPVLTATAVPNHQFGSGTPDTYTYTGSDGTPQTVQVNYTYFPQRTNFGCSGIPELNNTSFQTYFATSIVMPDGETYHLSYEPTPGYPGDITGRLAQITLPGGGSISFAYSGGHDGYLCVGDSSATLTRTVNDGNGHVGTWTYVKYPYTDNYGNFIVTATDPAGNVTTYHFHGEYQTEETVQDSQGHVLSQTVTCYNGLDLQGQAACVTPGATALRPGIPIYQTDVYSSPSTSPPFSLVETQYDYNSLSNISNGDIIAVKRYDAGATYGPTGSPVSETDITYANVGGITCGPVSQYIHDHPCVTKTVNSAGTILSLASYVYNTGGHPTQTSRMADSSHSLTSYASYNANGTIASSTDVNGAVTTYAYNGTGGCNNLLPTSVNYPLSLTTSQTWDCNGAVVISSTDMNSNVTRYAYDNMWRPTTTTYPDSGETSIGYNLTSSPPNITVSKLIDNTGRWLTTQTNLDGLFRPVRQILETDPVSPDTTDTTYNNLGQVYSVTNPYRSTNDQTYGLTYYQYDALGRTTQVTNPDGSTKLTTYSGRATEVQDEGNGTSRVTRVYQSDGLGRMTSVCEVTSATQLGNGGTPSSCGQDIAATGFLTSYGYDALGNLTSVTQPGVNTRTYAYDDLSRLTSETNPESNTTSYTYDSCRPGDLCTRVRPKTNQTNPAVTTTTTYFHDDLHRLVGKNYDDGITATVYYGYDVSPPWFSGLINIKGRLVQTSNQYAGQYGAGTASVYNYDPMGRITEEWQQAPTFAPGGYSIYNSYDYLGDQTYMYNAREGVGYFYTYNNAAQLTNFQSNLVDSNHPGTLLTVNQYNSLGEVQQETLGNGIVRNVQYDHRGRISSQADGSFYSYSLGLAADSDVLTGNDSVNGNWTYSYDGFNRLATSTQAGGSAFNYQYDRFGNRWQQNLTAGGGPAPSYAFNANNQSPSFTYDAAGNIINDGSHNYSYDAEGRMVSVDGGSTATYTYDASGRRVEKIVYGGAPVDFLYDLAGHLVTEATASSWYASELYAGNTHVALYANSTTYFMHVNWLGSTQNQSDMSQNSAQWCTYLPFGDGFSCPGNQLDLMNFTGDQWDGETRLSHTLFRQLSTTPGRWMTPDPAGMAAADPANPQSWNRYAYVMNNPLNATDPLGLECVWDDGSFDSSDDPNTGSIRGCTGAGGTYFDHSTFSAGGGQDWSPNPDQNIASLLDTVGPDQWVGNGTGNQNIQTPTSQVTVNGTTDQVDYIDFGFANGTTPNAGTQARNSQPCAPQSGKPSMGDSVSASTVNPFTSGGGGVWGANKQSFGATTNDYTYSGKGIGLDVGVSVQSVWAMGKGSWTGPFRSVNFSAGLFAGSVFWTPGKGGWKGLSLGLGAGFPGVAYEETNYTCRSAQ